MEIIFLPSIKSNQRHYIVCVYKDRLNHTVSDKVGKITQKPQPNEPTLKGLRGPNQTCHDVAKTGHSDRRLISSNFPY